MLCFATFAIDLPTYTGPLSILVMILVLLPILLMVLLLLQISILPSPAPHILLNFLRQHSAHPKHQPPSAPQNSSRTNPRDKQGCYHSVPHWPSEQSRSDAVSTWELDSQSRHSSVPSLLSQGDRGSRLAGYGYVPAALTWSILYFRKFPLFHWVFYYVVGFERLILGYSTSIQRLFMFWMMRLRGFQKIRSGLVDRTVLIRLHSRRIWGIASIQF